jgi:hypothetical protein
MVEVWYYIGSACRVPSYSTGWGGVLTMVEHRRVLLAAHERIAYSAAEHRGAKMVAGRAVGQDISRCGEVPETVSASGVHHGAWLLFPFLTPTHSPRLPRTRWCHEARGLR